MLDKAPNGKVSDLLDALDKALSAAEVDRAVDLFQDDCYWRDLVTFTWNIKTMEGKEQISAMLKARLADTRPSNWKIAEGEDASEADGITESWIQFETGVARGFGHLRLKDGRIWTLLTTMSELKGHEEPLGFDRPMGAKHGAERHRKTWKEEREAESRRTRLLASALLRHRRWRPGWHRAGSPAAPAQRADDHRRKKREARR